MARKVIVSKFNFFILRLREFARLFAAMACVNLVFPPQKLNSNETLQRILSSLDLFYQEFAILHT